MRMLPTALRRYIGNRTLQNFEQRLLHAFSTDIARNGRILGASGNLVDLIHIDDTLLRLVNIPIRRLQQLEQNIFNVLTDIACFCQRSRVSDRERYIQNLRQRLRDQSLTGTGRPDHHDIALLQFYTVILNRGLGNSLVMIVYGNG